MSAGRELLELAAKAVGNGANSWSDSHACLYITEGVYPNSYRKWNPLTDDGDALRLAVKLKIRLVEFNDTIVKSSAVAWREGAASCSLWEPEGADPYAATRRAIVRAAAEVGKAMP